MQRNDSCAEAQFYLNKCGVSRLDRDNDGVACEALC
ncbi:excalibur calcium-binding domain-containing protein [Acinetobacter bereziniae]|nr:excalibur calcium-binding domain-containing protein [Acinetobacter bereziniae]